MLDAVVHMKVGGGAQTFVIQAGQAEAFLQVFFEGVKRFELCGLSGRGPAAGTFPKHLKTAILQQADFITEHQAGFVHVWMLTGAIFDNGSDAIAEDLGFGWSGGTGAEAELPQAIDAFGKSRVVTFLSAEEHALTIMPECIRHEQKKG